jgi:hypothetical protein
LGADGRRDVVAAPAARGNKSLAINTVTLMKLKHLATFAALAFLLAAAPPPREAPPARSPWSRLVEGAKAFAHNPFGLVHRQPRGRMSVPDVAYPGKHSPNDVSAEAIDASAPRPEAGAQQRSAFLPESIAADRAASKPPQAKRAGWFSRGNSKSRSASEFMAQEKP